MGMSFNIIAKLRKKYTHLPTMPSDTTGIPFFKHEDPFFMEIMTQLQ